MRALVAGAGPAGLLTALVLTRRGYAVHLADPFPGDGSRTRPQLLHAHRYPASVWERLTTWLPDLQTTEAARTQRAALDGALWRLCRPHLAAIHARRIAELSFAEIGARVRIGGRMLRFDVLVDATGAARGTVGPVAEWCGAPVPMDEGPSGGGYLTVRLTSLAVTGAQPVLASRNPEAGAGAILITSSDATACLTLQLPRGAAAPADLAAICAFLARLPDGRLLQACAGARMQGRPVRFAGRPASRLALEAATDLPLSWVPVGDCLLSTQPYLGQGIDQLAEQVGIIDRGLSERGSWPEIRTMLVNRARERWWAATWTDAMYLALSESGRAAQKR